MERMWRYGYYLISQLVACACSEDWTIVTFVENLHATLEQIAKIFSCYKFVWSNLHPRFNWTTLGLLGTPEKELIQKQHCLLQPCVGTSLNKLSSTVRIQNYFNDGVHFQKRETIHCQITLKRLLHYYSRLGEDKVMSEFWSPMTL